MLTKFVQSNLYCLCLLLDSGVSMSTLHPDTTGGGRSVLLLLLSLLLLFFAVVAFFKLENKNKLTGGYVAEIGGGFASD